MLTEYLPNLKKEVLAREGKVVIRPDSGDPVDIICGNPNMISVFLNRTRKSLMLLKNIFIISHLHPIEVKKKLAYEDQLPIETTITTFQNSSLVYSRDLRTEYKSRTAFTAAHFHYPPFSIISQLSNGETKRTGVEVSIIKSIAKALQMKVTFKTPSDGKMWGIVLK